MEARNIEIKRRLRAYNISYFELGELLGKSETTIYRWLRKELDKSEREKLNKAIDELIKKREQ